MDRLTAMEAFVAVAEAGSFTRAGRAMRFSTSMITLHVQRLEQHLAVRLFNRSTRRVDLTEEGRQFLSYARAALDAYSVAERAVLPGAGIAGRVRLDAPASMGHAFILPTLPEFHRAHPDITVDLSLGDRGTFFRVDGFDLVLRAGDAPLAGWQVHLLGTTQLICVASPAYVEQHGLPASPDDLEGHRGIVYASVEEQGGNAWVMTAQDRKIRIRPRAAFAFNDGAAILAAARAGLGVAQTLEMLAREDIRAGKLIQILPEFTQTRLSIVLMGAPDRMALPHVKATLDFLVENVNWSLDRP